MNRDEYERNNKELQKYTTLPGGNNLALLIAKGSVAAAQESLSTSSHPTDVGNETLANLMKTITSVLPQQQGNASGKYTYQIIKELDDLLAGTAESDPLRKELEETIRITPVSSPEGNKSFHKHFINSSYLYDGNGDSPKNYTIGDISSEIATKLSKTEDSPTRVKPAVTIIEILKPGFSSTNRDANEVSIFTNLISPVEMSRCVPFMRMRIVPPLLVEEGTNNPIRTPPYFNIIGFLRGDKQPFDQDPGKSSLGPADRAMSVSFTNALGEKVAIDGGGSMELFTSPQTMMTTKGNLGNFTNPILDRSRPFMTLSSVKISVQPAAGIYSHKTATVEMILHDRSRLAQIAPFIKPDIFAGKSKCIFEMEYGWSHPDGENKKIGDRIKNPMGVFLNSLRCKENYEVYNSTYSFAESGQVNINLQLTMVSHTAMRAQTPDITDVKDKVTAVDALLKDINTSMKTITSNSESSQDNLKEIFGEIVMNGVGSADAALSMDLTKFQELTTKLETVRKKASAGSEAKKLADEILILVATVNQAQKTASEAAQRRLATLKSSKELFPVALNKNNLPTSTVSIPTLASLGAVKKTTVSLGKILYIYLAAPLALTGEFNEVQLIFGVHNDRASYMRSLSLARHPIDIESFSSDITEFSKKKPKMTIADFASMLNEKHISNEFAFAHGFGFMAPTKNKDGSETKPGIEAFEKQSKILIDDVKIRDGTYKKPNIMITPECVSASNGGTILRLHVVDTTAVKYQSYVDLLKASRDVSSNAINSTALDTDHPLMNNAPEYRWVRKSRSDLIKFLTDKKVITSLKKEEGVPGASNSKESVSVNTLALVEDARSLKKIVSKGLPYIRFGQMGGMVSSIGVAGLSDPALANAMLSVAGKRSSYTSAIEDQRAGVPMRVTPAELSMEMLGCPLVHNMQCFFVDLDTMTSLDGIYTISGVEHSFSPGSFNTSVKMISTGDGYSTFRSTATDVSSAVARWLQADPDASAALKRDEDQRRQSTSRANTTRDAQTAAANQASSNSESSATDSIASSIEKKMEELVTEAYRPLKSKVQSFVKEWMKGYAKREDNLIDDSDIDTLQDISEISFSGKSLADPQGVLFGNLVDFTDVMIARFKTNQDAKKSLNGDLYKFDNKVGNIWSDFISAKYATRGLVVSYRLKSSAFRDSVKEITELDKESFRQQATELVTNNTSPVVQNP
jgi:hypothetical protein